MSLGHDYVEKFVCHKMTSSRLITSPLSLSLTRIKGFYGPTTLPATSTHQSLSHAHKVNSPWALGREAITSPWLPLQLRASPGGSPVSSVLPCSRLSWMPQGGSTITPLSNNGVTSLDQKIHQHPSPSGLLSIVYQWGQRSSGNLFGHSYTHG